MPAISSQPALLRTLASTRIWTCAARRTVGAATRRGCAAQASGSGSAATAALPPQDRKAGSSKIGGAGAKVLIDVNPPRGKSAALAVCPCCCLSLTIAPSAPQQAAHSQPLLTSPLFFDCALQAPATSLPTTSGCKTGCLASLRQSAGCLVSSRSTSPCWSQRSCLFAKQAKKSRSSCTILRTRAAGE